MLRNKEQKIREIEKSIGYRRKVFADVLEEKAAESKFILQNNSYAS